jgi:hypothetical protein
MVTERISATAMVGGEFSLFFTLDRNRIGPMTPNRSWKEGATSKVEKQGSLYLFSKRSMPIWLLYQAAQ